jgi:hypothetical protein
LQNQCYAPVGVSFTNRTNRKVFIYYCNTSHSSLPAGRQGLPVKDTSTTAIPRGRQAQYTGNGVDFEIRLKSKLSFLESFNMTTTKWVLLSILYKSKLHYKIITMRRKKKPYAIRIIRLALKSIWYSLKVQNDPFYTKNVNFWNIPIRKKKNDTSKYGTI